MVGDVQFAYQTGSCPISLLAVFVEHSGKCLQLSCTHYGGTKDHRLVQHVAFTCSGISRA